MSSSPIRRILFPLLAVVLASAIASAALALRQKTVAPALAAAELPHKVPKVVCKVQSDYELHRSVEPDGSIYMLEHSGVLTVLKPDGAPLWTYDTGDHADTQAYAVTVQGTVFIVCGGGNLWALDKLGKLRFKTNIFTPQELEVLAGKQIPGVDYPGSSDPLATPDGGVVFLMRDKVVGFGPDGERRWICDMSEPNAAVGADGKPLPGNSTRRTTEFMDNLVVGFQIGPDGTVYVATDESDRPPDDGLRAISPDGRLLGKYPLIGRANVDPYVDLVIDEHLPGVWTGYDHSWRKLWEADVNSRYIDFDPVGNAYAATWDGQVVAVSPAGQVLWRTWLKADEVCAAGGGPLYALQRQDSRVVALDKATGKLLWDSVPSPNDIAQAKNDYGFFLTYLYAGPDGRAYFEGTGNWLFMAGP